MAKTKHSEDCRRVFNRYDDACPRCRELARGARPRDGWGTAKQQQLARQMREIDNHNCKRSGCGPICVAFD